MNRLNDVICIISIHLNNYFVISSRRNGVFSHSSLVITLPEGCALTTSTTKCYYYEKPSTVPVASRYLCIEKEKAKKRERETNREGEEK